MTAQVRCLCCILTLFICQRSFAQQPLLNSGEVLDAGRKLHDDGQYKQAIALYRQVSPNDTNYEQVLHELSLSAYADSDFSDALHYADTGLMRFPEEAPKWYSLRAQALDELGQRDSALADYTRVVRMAPYNYQAFFNRGLCLYHMERFTEAKADFKRCVMIYPNYASAHYFLGLVSMEEGNVVPCMLSFMAYLAIRPSGRYAGTVARLMTSLANVTDEVSTLAAKHQTGEEDNFETETEIFLSKAALDKKYALQSDLEDPIVRQMQALLEKSTYRAEDKGFWMQYYIPYFKTIYTAGEFNAMVYEMFSGLNIKPVNEWNKHHASEVAAFARTSEDYFRKISTTELLPLAARDTATVKYLFYDDEVQGKGNYVGTGTNVSLLAGPLELYYSSGALKSTGTLDDHTQRTGKWMFYHPNGRLKEISYYTAGKLGDTTRAWFDNGQPNQVVPWVDDNLQGTFRSWYYNGLPHMVVAYQGGKRSGLSVEYASNGFLVSRCVFANGDFDGTSTYYYVNGQPSSVDRYVKGKLEGRREKYDYAGVLTQDGAYSAGGETGPWKTYYSSGGLHETYTYDHGNLEGLYTEYYENGQVKQTQPYVKGHAEGKESDYTEGGRLYEEDTYERGKVRAVQFYGPDGKPTFSGAIRASGGVLTYYDSLGIKISEGNYSFRGDKEGVYTYFYPSGAVSGRSVYRGGSLDGPRVNFYPDGRLSDSVNYTGGNQDGYYAYYYENGRLHQEGWYTGGDRTGPYREYDDMGNLTSTAYFVNGEESGFADNYAPNGRKTTEYLYDEGWPIHYTEWDTAGHRIQDKDIPPGETEFHTWYRQGVEASSGHYRNYHPDGEYDFFYFDHSLSTRRFYRQGLADSTFTQYYYGGRKSMEGAYYLGNRTGPWKEYYPNGNLKVADAFRDDNLDGKRLTYNEDGTLLREETWINGVQEGAELRYGDSNRVSYIFYYHHGDLTGYGYLGKDGQPVTPIPLARGTGSVTAWYPNGRKSAELKVVNGQPDGQRTLWFSNGLTDFTGIKTMGKELGPQVGYYPNGHLKSEEDDYYDNLHGRCTYYYPSGILAREENYYDGELEGVSKTYDEGGHLIQTKVYYYGELQAVY